MSVNFSPRRLTIYAVSIWPFWVLGLMVGFYFTGLYAFLPEGLYQFFIQKGSFIYDFYAAVLNPSVGWAIALTLFLWFLLFNHFEKKKKKKRPFLYYGALGPVACIAIFLVMLFATTLLSQSFWSSKGLELPKS